VVLTAIFVVKLPKATDTAENPEITEKITETIKNYLRISSKLEWNEACKYLTGEALHNANRNSCLIESSSTLKIEEVSLVVCNENIAVAEADYSLITDGITDLAKDRFYLVNQGDWKIYRQEALPVFIIEELNQEEDETTRSAKRVITDYVNYVAMGDYNQAIKYLTGQELESAVKFLDMKPLEQNFIVKDIIVLALGEHTAFLEVLVKAEDRITTSIFELVFIDGWKIKKVSNL